MSVLTTAQLEDLAHDGMARPPGLSRHDSHVGHLVREAPILPESVTCGAIAERLTRHPEISVIVIRTASDTYAMVDRANYLPRYLDRFNRDLYARKPISSLMDKTPLIVDWNMPIERVGLLAASGNLDSIPSAFIIVRDGACAGIGMGADLMRAIAGKAQERLLNLQHALDNLVQAQTFASLGRLVAGVAHEINTPIGVGLTAASHLRSRLSEMKDRFLSNQLTRSDLVGFATTADEASSIIVENIERAAELIRSFKSVAVDRTMAERRQFNLLEVIQNTRRSLGLSLRQRQLEITVECGADIEMDSYPGSLAQVLASLMLNAATHGFDVGQNGEFLVAVTPHEEFIEFLCSDNGRGIPADNLVHIFKPFFTTLRGRGGSGLGLHIAHNIVTQILGGTITCESAVGVGTTFRMRLPRIVGSETAANQTVALHQIYEPASLAAETEKNG
jgi:signal transduction histidine kinase